MNKPFLILNSTFLILITTLFTPAYTQDCGCVISEVESNSVKPCDKVIGDVILVSTVQEFKAAISEVNNNGGDKTILIADGTYAVASTASYPYITASNLVIRSESGNRDAVILTGEGMKDVAPDTEIVLFAVGDNITIADLTIQDVGNHGIAVTGDDLFVHNVKILDTYEQMIKGNTTAGGIENGVVQCCLFEYTDKIGPQWYIGGLDIHSGLNWLVRDNVFKYISSPSVAVAEHAVHFWIDCENNVVERNKIVNCDRGIGFGLGDSGNIGGVIKNNMITNDGTYPFNDVGIGLESSPDTKVYNNTIFIAYQNAIEFRFESSQNIEISNNLTNQAIRSRNGGVANLDGNYTAAQSDWFINTEEGNLRFTEFIPEIVNNGSALNDVIVDIDQTSRPANALDKGAFEFVDINSAIPELETNKISCYPTPSHAIVSIELSEHMLTNKNISFSVYNTNGQLVHNHKMDEMKKSIPLDVSEWEAGMYILKASSEGSFIASTSFIVLKK